MNKVTTILILVLGLFSAQITVGQDYFGAALTGKHTVGVNAKWDGKFSVGVHYNIRKFDGPFTRSVDVNLIGQVRINKGIDKVSTEMGVTQVYANGNDFKGGFGLGTRIGFGYEYCPTAFRKQSTSCHSVNANLNLLPGRHDIHYAACASVKAELIRFNFSCNDLDYNSDKESVRNMKITSLSKVYLGAHTDWTNTKKGGGGFHMTLDGGNSFYTKQKKNAAWNTWLKQKEKESKENTPNNTEEPIEEIKTDSCPEAERNIEVRISHSIRF